MKDAGNKSGADGSRNLKVCILQTTDLHDQILPYNYFTDQKAPGLGLAGLASMINDIRDDTANVLLLDNGDALQGSPLSDWVAETDNQPHPMISTMNALRYDAASLGNHEFNYGLDYLADAMGCADFPMVCANVVRKLRATAQDDVPFAPPWTILTREFLDDRGETHALRIGVIGFAPPQIPAWDKYTLDGAIETRDILNAAEAHLPNLWAENPDIVIALCHSGISDNGPQYMAENVAADIAGLPGIDVVIAGHTHGVFPGNGFPKTDLIDPVTGTLNGKAAVMAGAYGSHLGRVDLTLTLTATGWEIVGQNAQAIAHLDSTPTDPHVTAALAETHETLKQQVRRPISRTTTPLHSYTALIEPAAHLALMADAMRWTVRDIFPDTPNLIAAVSPYRAGGNAGAGNYINVPSGALLARHANELYPYPSTMVALRLSGCQVKAWLETAAKVFLQIEAGAPDQPLINTDVPSYDFDVLDGLSYDIDTTQPEGHRIIDLCFEDGLSVRPTDTITLLTNGYRAGGGGHYDVAREATVLWAGRKPLRDSLVSYLDKHPLVCPQTRPTWRLAKHPKTSGVFETGSAEHARTGLLYLGPGENGFHRYRVDLAMPHDILEITRTDAYISE